MEAGKRAGLEPAGKQIVPLDVKVENERASVVVKWGDGHTSVYPISRLRGYCPCALCQGHDVGGLKYIDNKVTAIFDVELVGRYAINFKFADAHNTGIYRWDMLRRLDPDEAERWGPPEDIGRA
jgi:DUF971 family protein